MTVTPIELSDTDKARQNVINAREGVESTDSRTRAMNSHLADISMFDELVNAGRTRVSFGSLDTALAFGGMKELALDGESTVRVREALKAYGEFLILVANNAY